MVRIQYQLLKVNEPIALGNMEHCLDVFYWEIYYGNNHLEYNIVPFSQEDSVSKSVAPSSFNNHRSISKPIPDREHATPPKKEGE